MKTITAVAIIILALGLLPPAKAAKLSNTAQLQSALACQSTAKPEQVEALIHQLRGVRLVGTSTTDAEYSLPNPVEVYGAPITRIIIHRNWNEDGEFVEYQSIFDGEFKLVATFANVAPDADGYYRKEIGNNDLILRPEAGVNYIACASGIRSFPKAVKRAFRSAGS